MAKMVDLGSILPIFDALVLIHQNTDLGLVRVLVRTLVLTLVRVLARIRAPRNLRANQSGSPNRGRHQDRRQRLTRMWKEEQEEEEQQGEDRHRPLPKGGKKNTLAARGGRSETEKHHGIVKKIVFNCLLLS